MAGNNQALTVTVNAETGGATAGLASVEERLVALEAAFARSTAASQVHVAASERSTIATRVEAEAATGLGGALDSLATHYRIVSSGAEVFGLETSGAAAKVAGLTEVIEGLEASMAPLLIALVAIEVAFKSFEYLKDAIADAGALESQMATLGSAVASQGGNWAEAKDGLESFIESEQLASGFTTGQLVPALNSLVTAGNDVHDSQIIMGVAEELARAKHISLAEATQALIDAEAGRGKGLVKLDLNLKDVVNSHGKMSQALAILHRDMGGAITNSNTLEMSQARLKVVQEQLAETVGKVFLPILIAFNEQMIGATKNAEDLGSGLIMAFQGIGGIIGHAAAMFEHFAGGIAAFATGNFKGSMDQFSSVGTQWTEGFKSADTAAKGFQKTFNELFHGQGAGERGHALINGAIGEHNERLSGENLRLDNDRKIQARDPKAKAEKTDQFTHSSFKDEEYKPEKVDQYAIAQKNLEATLKGTDGAEKMLAESVIMATTAQGKHTAQAALDAQVLADLTTKRERLTSAITTQNSQEENAAAKHAAAETSVRSLTIAYNALGNSLNDGHKLTDAESNAKSELKDKLDKAKIAAAEFKKAADEMNVSITKNNESLNSINIALSTFHTKAQMAAAAASLAWDDFYTKSAQKAVEDAAVVGLTSAQKAAYYHNMWASIDRSTTEGEKEAEQVWGKYEAAVKSNLDEIQKAHQKWIDDSTKRVSSFIGDIVIQHKSMKDELKSIYDEILKSFIDMVSKMIVQSALFGAAFGNLGGGGSSGGGLFGSLISGVGGGGSAPNGTSSNPIHVVTADAGPAWLTKVTGSASGVDPTAVATSSGGASAGGILGIAALAFGAGSAIGGAEGGGSHSTFGGIGALAGLAGAGAIGLAAGGVGGLSGGIAALMSAGPAGWAVLAGAVLLGGAAGGMFGSKGPNAHDNPDQAGDVNSYAAFVANMTGGDNEHFGNVTKSADQQYNMGAGNKPLAQQLGDYVNALTSTAGMTQSQKDAIAKLKSLEGAGKSDGLDIVREDQGTFTLSSGKKISVADYQSLIANVQGAAGGSAGGPIPTFAVSRSYGDYNASTLGANGSTPPNGVTGVPPVNIVVNGNVVGTNGMTELATIVGKTMYDQQRGTGPTGGRQGMFSRNGGSF